MNGKRNFISLKTKIMLSTLIPVFISFIIIAVIIFTSLFNSLRESAEEKISQVSQKYSYSFDSKISSAMNYLVILSSELELDAQAELSDREALQKMVLEVFSDYGLLDGSSVYFEADMYDGRDDEYIGTDYGTATSGKICWYFYKDNGEIAYLPEGIENDIEFTLPHYVKAKEANNPIYTDPVAYEISGKNIPMFTLTYPIRNEAGEFIGAVTVDLFLDDIYNELQNEVIYKTGYILITNDNGQVVYSPNYEDIGKTTLEAGISSLPKPSDDGLDSSISVLGGELVSVNAVYVPQLDSSFYISVSAPLSEINADGYSLTAFLVTISLLVIAVLAILLNYLIGRISAPLDEITESVDRIASGDYRARIKGAYKGEYAVVKDSVNKMADSIEASLLESENSLNVLKNILNGLDTYIYVSDPVTDEILFINDIMTKHFDIDIGEPGQTCWSVLQTGFDKKCEFCPCYQLDLDPDTPVVWEEQNTITKRYYRNTDLYIDWIGGNKVHLQQSVDITDMKTAALALDKRLAQQALMTSISQSFLSDEDMDTLITNTLRLAGEFTGVPQVLFHVLDDDGITLTCQNEWLDPSLNLPSHIGMQLKLNGRLYDMMNGLTDDLEFCLCSNDPNLKEATAEYRRNFHNYITSPVFIKNKMYAALDFSREDDGRLWTESDINLATFISSLLSGVFERQTMQYQLRRLSSIVESSPQFILYVTADGKVDYVNPAAMPVTGYTEAELIAGGLDLIFDKHTLRDIEQIYIPATLREGTDNFEISLIRKDGAERIMAFSSFTTGSGSDNVGCIARDVTEIRKLEAELIAAKDLAEQGSRSKSEFLSRMSHEMRTPMNAIIGMTSIAKNSDDPAKKEYCLERIDNASRHLLGVINDILDMSKIEANKFDLSYTEFSFEHMLMSVINVINYRVEENKQELSLHIDPDMPDVLIGDEQHLSQVITNLLTNASKFTPEHGSIKLGAAATEEEDGVFTIQVEVIDSGIGISDEQIPKLFRSFEQADGSIARKFGGTGLGLAISKRIVELMGGDIWVESEVDAGSRFVFTFKAEKGHLAEPVKKSVKVSDLNVMVVDDSPEVGDYFKYVMDGMGALCTVASNGQEALERFREADKPFDILFIDWNMPIMNGVELTKELRKASGESPIIIMISVAEWSDIEHEATAAGVNDFVSKPLFPSLLMDCLNKHLGVVEAETAVNTDDLPRYYEGKTALLAEDVAINREIILTVLEDSKLVIDCAEDGRQAVEMFASDPGRYDIIIMDVHMPEVDGLEATRRIRALDAPEGKAVPIVAMTANVFQEDVEKCLAAGMNDHIGKPINLDELFNKLNRYLYE